MNEVVGEFERLAPKAIERLETGFVDAMAVMLPPEGTIYVVQANAAEYLNREIQQRERV